MQQKEAGNVQLHWWSGGQVTVLRTVTSYHSVIPANCSLREMTKIGDNVILDKAICIGQNYEKACKLLALQWSCEQATAMPETVIYIKTIDCPLT